MTLSADEIAIQSETPSPLAVVPGGMNYGADARQSSPRQLLRRSLDMESAQDIANECSWLDGGGNVAEGFRPGQRTPR